MTTPTPGILPQVVPGFSRLRAACLDLPGEPARRGAELVGWAAMRPGTRILYSPVRPHGGPGALLPLFHDFT